MGAQYEFDDSLEYAIYDSLVGGDISNVSQFGISEEKSIKSITKRTTIEEFNENSSIRYIELQYHSYLLVDDIKELCFTNKIPNQEIINYFKSKKIKLFKRKDGYIDEI